MEDRTNKQKALIYCRVSSVRQKQEGHGLESQEHRCRTYCADKGYEVEAVFRDSFTGAGDFMKRPAMSDLFRHMDDNPHKLYVVVFDDLSRFARDTEFHLKLAAAFKARGAKRECLNFNFDDSPEGMFAETVIAASNALDRQKNRRQVIQKQKARLEKGYWPFYHPPGYKQTKHPLHGKLLVPNEPKASIIKEALEGFASGRFQEQVDVQRFLQKKDFCDGRPVYLETVKRLLERAIYAGYIEYPEWEVARRTGYHEALISLETHEKIIQKLNGSTVSFVRKKVNENFPLRGSVNCPECNKPITASFTKGRNKKFPYYWCKTKGCSRRYKAISKEILESSFEDVLDKIKPKQSVLDLSKAILLRIWNKKISELGETKQSINLEINKTQEEIDNLVVLAGKTKRETVIRAYEQQIDNLEKRKQVLSEKLIKVQSPKINFETALDKVFSLLRNPLFKWRNGDINDKKLVLKLVFVGPLVYGKEKGFETADFSLPLRVFEHIAVSKSQDVEMAGVEPASGNFLK